jgi:hypothetical protein
MFPTLLSHLINLHHLVPNELLTTLLILSIFPAYKGRVFLKSRHGCMIDFSFTPVHPPFGLRDNNISGVESL